MNITMETRNINNLVLIISKLTHIPKNVQTSKYSYWYFFMAYLLSNDPKQVCPTQLKYL